ncbi:hypothetical protein [Anoxynatronum sibiricum]|uniref:Uncharacterized protein n=1 Tax=Anoxynatronum sibiricum TaxID=210623 RepID=A0ABU9VT72_9CLOT
MKEILFFIFDNMTDYEITFAMHMLNTSVGHGFIGFSAEIMDWYGMFKNEKEKLAFLNFMTSA